MFENLNPMKRAAQAMKAGAADADTATYYTTPWRWRDAGGVYVGHNRDVWIYREMTVNPLQWEDPNTRLALGSPMANLLVELGATSKDMMGGMRSLSRNREIHILSINYETEAKAPEGTPAELKDYLDSALNFLIPAKTLLVGVRLRSSAAQTQQPGSDSTIAQMKTLVTKALGEETPDLAAYEKDRVMIEQILSRNGAGRIPTRDVMAQMESWYNLGRGPDASILETKNMLYVDEGDHIEMSAVMRFENPIMHAPDAQWALDAITHPAGAFVVSIRGELEPSTVSRKRARASERKILNQMEEEAATGDIERAENSEIFHLAREVENFIRSGREPLITACSIVMARKVGNDVNETYIDDLRTTYGIEMKPLEHRQLDALEETLPCSSKRVNPFLQDVSVSMLAYAGLQGFSNLGDPTGVHVGLVDPDYTPCFLNPLGAPAANLPPAMGVFGDPGSGKTFLTMMIATQATLAGMNVVFINPKGMDSLSPFAELVGGRVVSMSKLEEQGGYFDPFGYAEPEMAAEIANTHILSVLGSTHGGFTQTQEVRLGAALKRGAMAGARCVWEALQYVEDEEVKLMIREQAEASTTFALGIGTTPRSREKLHRGLTLIEFDRKLDLPDSGKPATSHTRAERIALAAIRLVTRASLEMLATSNGGVMVVDEAWTFLSQSEGLAALQQIGREGRSLNILPIFATQRVADLIKEGVDMEGYLSRVFVMKLMDEREAKAALHLCGLEATPERIAWLRQAGPRREENGQPARPSLALHRDLKNRHSALMVGPVPEAAREAFTTNPADRAAKLAAAQRAEAEAAARAAAANAGQSDGGYDTPDAGFPQPQE